MKRANQRKRHETNTTQANDIAERQLQQDVLAARCSLSVNKSQERKYEKRTNISKVTSRDIGKITTL